VRIFPFYRKNLTRSHFFVVASDGWDLSQPKALLDQEIAGEHLPYPVLLDQTHSLATALQAQVTPQTFLISPQGKIYSSNFPVSLTCESRT
jgi:hypothetical protein